MASFPIAHKLNLLLLTFIGFNLINSIEDDYFCGTIDVPLNPLIPQTRTVHYFGKLHFGISIFYDQSLYYKYDGNVSAIKEFVYRIMNSVNRSFRSSRMKRIADITFDVRNIGFFRNKLDEDGNGNNYRRDFCQYVKYYSTRNLMASVLLTGAHNSQSSSTQGLAHIDVACDWSDRNWGGLDPCALVEARSFKAAYIMAHELGHTLGMNHDELLGCGSTSIMSSSTGDGKTKWSECSLNQLSGYLFKLSKYNNWCLTPNTDLSKQEYFNYSQTTVDHQCQTSLGTDFQEYNGWNIKNDICHRIECSEGSVVVPIHPALENTQCGTGMACRAGVCTFKSDQPF